MLLRLILFFAYFLSNVYYIYSLEYLKYLILRKVFAILFA